MVPGPPQPPEQQQQHHHEAQDSRGPPQNASSPAVVAVAPQLLPPSAAASPTVAVLQAAGGANTLQADSEALATNLAMLAVSEGAAQPPAADPSPQQLQSRVVLAAASAGPACPTATSSAQDASAEQQLDAAPEAPETAAQEEHATLFFAKVPRSAPRAAVEGLFARYGEVVELNLFMPCEGSVASKGCGLVVLKTAEQAAAALAGLEKHVWSGMHSSMVLKLMQPGAVRTPPPHDASANGNSQQPGARASPRPSRASSAAGSGSVAGSGSAGGGGSVLSGGSVRTAFAADAPPPGCGPGSYKLFIGNLPKTMSEPDLLPVFESIGPVKELVVLRDKQTHKSKGSAFVWYSTAAQADRACMQFNMRLVLQAPGGPPSRPLVVRPAAAAHPAPAALQPQQLGAPAYAAAYLPAATAMAPTAQPADNGMMQGGYVLAAAPASGMAAAPSYVQCYAAPQQQLLPVSYDGSLQQQQQQLQQQQLQQQQVWQVAGLQQAAGLAGVPQYAFVQEQVMPQQGQQLLLQQQEQQPYVFMPGSACGYVSMPQQHGQQQQDGMHVYEQHALVVGGGMLAAAPAPAQGGSGGGQQVQSGSSAGTGSGLLLGVPPDQQQQQQQQHSVTVPLSAQQLAAINAQLGSVAAMSGASIAAEQSYACGGLALSIAAASHQQVVMAWQLVQGLLSGAGSQAAGQAAGGP